MGLSGTIDEVIPGVGYSCTATFDEAWYPGKERNTVTLTDQDDQTLMTLLVRYDSKEARETALSSGMSDGMEPGQLRKRFIAIWDPYECSPDRIIGWNARRRS
jgi:hypothetical protein